MLDSNLYLENVVFFFLKLFENYVLLHKTQSVINNFLVRKSKIFKDIFSKYLCKRVPLLIESMLRFMWSLLNSKPPKCSKNEKKER